ncbi:MAG TPA: RHS repeat-associated core domain-containing protein [Thermoanaerobaculia bacterium]|jgi:RHS repeat-associated protein|nr:RHS repeat-associated core domain-containing protein [Thermoanaerobaculia bacterium]
MFNQRTPMIAGKGINVPSACPRAAALFLLMATLMAVPRVEADCSASLTLQNTGNGNIHFLLIGSGSCPNQGDDQTPVNLSISQDSGPFVDAFKCLSSPCSTQYDLDFSCLQGEHSWQLQVECWKAVGSSCEQDQAGLSSRQTVNIDHTPSITSVSTNTDSGGPGLVVGSITYQAPAAWTDNGISVEWLGGTSSPSFFGSNGGQGPDYTAGFSAGPDGSGSTMLLITVEACSDRKASTVVNADDNECPAGGGSSSGSSCPSCVGRPIRVSNGNMRMTDRDPLPASEALSLTRTYDSRGVPGFFGNGWGSVFDARLRTYQSQALGTTFLEIRTASNSKYLFQNIGGSWLQMWPQGTTPAVLTAGAGTYTLREPNSVVETVFDAASGRVTRTRSRALGRDAVIAYANGSPTNVVDSWGNWSWTIALDSANRISTISVDGTSLAWTYNYDGNDNLASVTGPSGAAWRSYTYGGDGLTAAHDAPGNLIESHAYTFTNGVSRAGSSLADQDDITSITYLIAGRDNFEKITRTTSGTGATTDFYSRIIAGRPRTVQIDGHCASCGTNDAVYAYDLVSGNLLREQDARGYITVRTFDDSNRVISEARPYQPVGCDPMTDLNHCRQTPTSLETVLLAPTASTLTTTYAYGDTNWPEIATDTSTVSVLDPNESRTTSVQLDPATGAVTQQVMSGLTGSPAQAAQYTTTTTLYDGSEGAAFNPGGAFDPAWMSLAQPPGLRKSSDGPRTDVADITTLVYYPISTNVPALLRGHLAAVRDAAGNVTRFESYDIFGNPGRTVDANGVATESTFDTMGRALTSTLKGVTGCDTTADPLCATDLVSSRSYQPALGPLASTTMPGGGATTYEYDTRGRTSAMTRQVSATLYERMEYDYDPATGRKSAERYLTGHPSSWTITRSEAFQYDTFARLSEIDHPDGSKVIYHYDGANNLISVQDERHLSPNTNYAYDPTNRLASVTQTLSTEPSSQIATAYAYDVHGNLTSVTDPNGNVTSYVYDDFGRMLRQTSPVTGVTTYAYDPAGNLINTTDANSATTTRGYDPLNRVTSAASSGSTSETISWTYDGSGAFGLGRLASMTDPTGSTSYSYERRGFLQREQKTIGSATYSSGYQYDSDGNRSSIAYPSGRTVTYTFDLADHPFSVSSGATTIVSSAAYLPFGPATQLVFGNGTTKTMSYDSRYRPLENKLTTATGTIADYNYAEDAGGNILQIHDATDPSFNRDFGYDDLNRLTTANSGSALWGNGGYSYDAMGNLLTSTLGSRNTSFAYFGTTPKLSSVVENGTPRSVTYDPAGNELAIGSASYDYSARNQLVGGDRSTYAYDGRGVRTITTVPAGLATLTVNPTSALGGTTLSATVTLDGPASAGGQSIAISSSSTAATVPATVIVPEGAVGATFDITTSAVSSSTTVVITASDGSRVRTAPCTLQPLSVSGLTITPAEVTGGQTATATITLNGAAADTGLTVSILIAGSNTSAPPTVTIAAGSTSGTFTVTTTPVPATSTTTISATANGGTASTSLQIDPPVPAVLTIQPPSVTGGTNATGTVTLNGPAPSGGTLVALTSDNSAVSVPANVTVVAGSTSATFMLSTSSAVSSATTATVRASVGTTSVTATLAVEPPPVALASLVLSPATVEGGLPVNATVTLTNPAGTGGALVAVTSDDLSIASVPDSVLVAQGATAATFTIDTTTILTQTVVGITASFNGVSQTIPLTVQPPANLALLSLTITPVNVAGGSGATGTVTLTGSAPNGGADVSLMSDNTSVVNVPSHVTVRKGDTTATFAITTFSVTATQSANVSGSYGGLTQHDTLTVIPASAVQLTSLTITPSSVSGGTTATGTVTMSAPAPTGGLLISLASRHRNFATVPPSVTVPGGAATASFTVSAQAVKSTHTVDITATYASVTKTAQLTVTKSVAGLSIFGRIADMFRHVPLSLSVSTDVAQPLPTGLPSRYSLYTPELNLMTETETTTSSSPAIAYEYIWFGGQPVAQFDVATNTTHWTFFDHLGTPILQTNAAGAVDWRVEYDPYGTANVVRAGASRHQPLRFPGQEYDEASTDRNYNIFRWYRSESGRYTQSDPIGLDGGIDLYAYGNGNPLQVDDTNGLSFVDVRKADEKRYNSLAEYQHANPCQSSGTSYSCTQRLLEDIACPCSCKGTGWGMDVSAIVQVRYNLAGGEPGSNLPPTFYWNGYRRHEDLHLEDLRKKLKEYADGLESQRYDSATECNIACGKVIGGFHQWLNDWATDSNRRLH